MVLVAWALLSSLSLFAFAQAPETAESPFLARPRDRVAGFIDEEQRATLVGSHHLLAQPRFEIGGVKTDFPMQHVILMLKPDSAQQAALRNLLAAQQDPESSYYHQWITPETYGQYFGVSENDAARVVNWLQMHGLTVEEITPGRRAVIFSASAQQIASTFHTQIRTYSVEGKIHHGNATDPQIPLALAPVIDGVASLHDFHSRPLHTELVSPQPEFTSGGGHYLAPADLATIYDLGPLYQQSINGSGQSIAIVGRTNINLSDVRMFRTNFGLPANDPQIIVNGTDPGIVSSGEETEADLDVQWSGAVAKNATIKFVVSASTNSSDGAFLSAQYIVNHNVAPVMSMSFGLCEASEGSSGNNFLNSLWQQAAAEGITVLVSSGDSGAAGCDSSSATTATGGRAVNALCSTPYSVCVGGTEFADATNPTLYWSGSNTSGTQASALSYIPESVWNESGSSGLWAGGGGASAIYSKPTWQTGPGVPADGRRDVPDVSLTAAGHDGYLVYINGGLYVVGGTSAASPSFAGIMALVVQSTATREGNANPAFYNLASKQASGGAAVFHDVKTGNNSVPGVSGYSAGTGYDLASGLGSVDANAMVSHWSDAITVPSYQLSTSASSLSVAAGNSGSVTLTSAISAGFNAVVALSISSLPSGVTASFTPSSLTKPGSGSTVLKFTTTGSAPVGSYPLTVTASSGGISKTAAVTLTVLAPPNFTLTGSASTVAVAAGASSTLTLTTAANSSFNGPIALSIKNLPSGMTGSFSLSTVTAPGSGSSTLTLTASAGAAAGSYNSVITASGGGISKTVSIAVNVPGFTLAASKSSLSLAPGAQGTLTLTSGALATFNSAVALSATGLPSGVTAGFSPSTVTAPGSGSSVLTLTRAAGNKTASTSTVTLSASGGGVTKTVKLTLTLTAK